MTTNLEKILTFPPGNWLRHVWPFLPKTVENGDENERRSDDRLHRWRHQDRQHVQVCYQSSNGIYARGGQKNLQITFSPKRPQKVNIFESRWASANPYPAYEVVLNREQGWPVFRSTLPN